MSYDFKSVEHTGDYLIVGCLRLSEGGKAYRVLNTVDNICKDEYMEDIIYSIARGAKFRNVTIENGRLVGVNGKLERYPYVTESNSALTIIEQYVDNSGNVVGYRVASNSGAVFKWSKENTLKALRGLSDRGVNPVLTNGKFDGNKIAPIVGLYRSVTPKNKEENRREKLKTEEVDEKVLVDALINNICEYYSSQIGRYVISSELKYFPFGFHFNTTEKLTKVAYRIYNEFGGFEGIKFSYSRSRFIFKDRNSHKRVNVSLRKSEV